MTEQLLLDADVERAHRREGIEHPILALFEREEARLKGFMGEYQKVDPEDNQARQKYVRENFGFFADAAEQVGDFSFGPLEIIAVWSKVDETGLLLYPRYTMAGIVTVAYVTMPVQTGEGMVRYFVETGKAREDILAAQKEIMRQRLRGVHSALDEIGFYRLGMRKGIGDLMQGIRTEEGMELFRKADENSKRSPLMEKLGEIGENFSNGLLSFSIGLYR